MDLNSRGRGSSGGALAQKNNASSDFGAVVGGGATVGAHIDEYELYDLLVGESDGGVTLPEREFERLKALARATLKKGRLFVTWRNVETGMDCVNCGPQSRCFCAHSWKAHKWWETDSRRPGCRVPGCKCRCFDYLPKGSPRCSCKHEVESHRSRDGRRAPKCAKCPCTAFAPPQRCTCGAGAAAHATAVEATQERAASGRVTEALWDQPGRRDAREQTAVAGGLTSFISFAPGVDRAALHPSLALAAPSSSSRGHGRRSRAPLPPTESAPSNYEAYIDSLGR